jgi:hypothetical protein
MARRQPSIRVCGIDSCPSCSCPRCSNDRWRRVAVLRHVTSPYSRVLAGRRAGLVPLRAVSGSAHPSLVPFQAFPAQDGWLIIACPKQEFWHSLVAPGLEQRLCRDTQSLGVVPNDRQAWHGAPVSTATGPWFHCGISPRQSSARGRLYGPMPPLARGVVPFRRPGVGRRAAACRRTPTTVPPLGSACWYVRRIMCLCLRA